MADVVESSNQNKLEDHVLEGSDQEGHSSGVGGHDTAQTLEHEGTSRDNAVDAKNGGDTSRADDQYAARVDEKEDEHKPSKLKAMWGKLGLDAPTIIIMFKGSLPPLISIAFYQSPTVAATFATLGYVVPIISVLSMCILPRAKYIQTLILNIIGTCVGGAIAILGVWSGVQARIHTTPAGTMAAYNSSQAVVCAIWLFANIWFVNTIRAKVPALQFPAILYSIFTNVAFTYGPLLLTFEEGEALVTKLLEGFLTAFAISTAVSLLIFPVSSRTVVFNGMAQYIGAIRGSIKAQTAYLQSLERGDMFNRSTTQEANNTKNNKKDMSEHDKKKLIEKPSSKNLAEAKELKDAITSLTALHGKLHGDLPFAKMEAAYGKLGPKDLNEIFTLFQAILIPLIGMSTITDIFEHFAERRGWVETTQGSNFDNEEVLGHGSDIQARLKEKRLWNDIMKQLHEPFAVVSHAMDQGMEHAGLLLELIKPQKSEKPTAKAPDIEAKGDGVKPGDQGFTSYLEKRLSDFYSKRGESLAAWAREKGLAGEEWNASMSSGLDGSETSPDEDQHSQNQQELYLILYMDFLLYSTGTAILNFIRFAEGKVGKNSRLIVPGQRRLRKWIMSLDGKDSTVDSATPDSVESGSNTVYMGAGFKGRKDPEHLPATTEWQRFGNGIRTISHFLGSAESAFGFRAALATMTVGITAFLVETQTFFVEQRLVWAMIIVAISMTITAGQSVFGFLARTGGTAISMVLSILIWYIVDSNTPGVIVLLWFLIFIEYYFFLKFPRFIPVWVICIVTQVLIIGYEIQVYVIGIQASAATGQPYYPTYELAPYRLACVAGGCLVAFIWTIFPYPLTDRSWLRKDLGSTIYLLANYYSVVHSTTVARIHHAEGDMEDKSSPGRQLEKVRRKIFGKLLLLLPSLHQHAEWQKWEPVLGGKFPKETYDSITLRLTNITNYISLLSYSTRTWSNISSPDTNTSTQHAWIDNLSLLLDKIEPTSHSITSILTLLSAAVAQGSALPPYMQLPQPYGLSKKLEQLDKGILDSRHVEEPGYSAYAVMQIVSTLLTDDLRKLVEDVKGLVGEVDFSFKVVDSGASTQMDGRGGGNGKGKID